VAQATMLRYVRRVVSLDIDCALTVERHLLLEYPPLGSDFA
jgi:hypothetical protein